jgi:hypothetical protein
MPFGGNTPTMRRFGAVVAAAIFSSHNGSCDEKGH